MKKIENIKNIEVITEAIRPIRDLIRDAAIKSLTYKLDVVSKKITEADFNLQVVAPYPHSTRIGAHAFEQARGDYHYAISITTKDEERCIGHWGMNAPRYAFLKDRATLEASIFANASKHADDALVSYAYKLAAKIVEKIGDKHATSCKYFGSTNPWVASQIVFTFDDATSATFTTSMILNCSCLGKLFNQFPTRLKK
jgi:hypothetical protein